VKGKDRDDKEQGRGGARNLVEPVGVERGNGVGFFRRWKGGSRVGTNETWKQLDTGKKVRVVIYGGENWWKTLKATRVCGRGKTGNP